METIESNTTAFRHPLALAEKRRVFARFHYFRFKAIRLDFPPFPVKATEAQQIFQGTARGSK
jgi:hypothetical protein